MRMMQPSWFTLSAFQFAISTTFRIIIVAWLTFLPMLAAQVRGAEGSGQPAANAEYPLVIFAISSGERLRERSQQLAEAVSLPDQATKLLLTLTGGLSILMESEGFDATRPAGLMSFLTDEKGEQGLRDKLEGSSVIDIFDPDQFLERGILFFPVRDASVFMESFGKLANEKFIPTAGKPGHFENEKGEAQPVRVLGKYVFYFTDESPDRPLPDLSGLLRPLLINRDVVLSIQARGIPKAIREIVGEQIKMSTAAGLQRFDDEPEVEFRWRTALGAFQQELIDIAVSHVDEINLGLKFDPSKSAMVFDLDLVGPKNGKLAKLCSGLSTKRGFFQAPAEEPEFEFGISTPISQRMAKPLIDALLTSAKVLKLNDIASAGTNALAEISQSLATTLEAGHFDMRLTVHGPVQQPEYLLGLRLGRTHQFAEALPVLLTEFAKVFGTTYDLETIDEVPVHRTRLGHLADILDSIADEFFANVAISAESPVWFAIGPQTVWIASGTELTIGPPASLREAIQAQSNPRTASVKPQFPVGLKVHTRNWLSPSDAVEQEQEVAGKIEQVAADSDDQKKKVIAEQSKQLMEIVYAAFRERPDSIQLDVRPADTGLKIRMTCEEALVTMFAASIARASLSLELED
ncbi:MAG: hypothetical protein WCJ09_04415 [Planctomycetota bacterium]